MKFYLSMALALILGTLTTDAQHIHINYGVKGGLNFYNIHNDKNSQYDTKVGFHLGVLGHIHLNKQIAIQPEIVYSAEGAKYTSGGVETKINLGYINIPVMLQYMFENGFRLEAGPQIGFLVSSKSETGGVSSDTNGNTRSVDFSLGMGAGYIWSSGFGIDARYNLGLSNLNESSIVKSTNRGFQLGVFYQLGHK